MNRSGHLIIRIENDNGKINKLETGSYLYRIGGDEYVLISYNESYESVNDKIELIQEEVRNMDIGVNESIGINYGLVVNTNSSSFKELYMEADSYLSENKRETYKALGLERRR